MAGGETGDAASGEGGTLTWGNWANPGEATRFREVSKAYEAEYETKITYQIVTGDYNSKLLTQLAGGSAPDAFYVSTEGMAKLIESKNVVDLTEFTVKPESPVKVEDFYPGLLPWCKPADRCGHLRPAGGLQPAGLLVQQGHGLRAGHHPEPGSTARGRHLEP